MKQKNKDEKPKRGVTFKLSHAKEGSLCEESPVKSARADPIIENDVIV
jgi:hypothetical protein